MSVLKWLAGTPTPLNSIFEHVSVLSNRRISHAGKEPLRDCLISVIACPNGIAFVDIYTGSWYIDEIIQIQPSDHSFDGANVADRQ